MKAFGNPIVNLRRFLLISLAFVFSGIITALSTQVSAQEESMALQITSPVFEHEGKIPSVYTCEGEDISPPLVWSGAPAGTLSMALIVSDPDAPDPHAPKMVWDHWLLYNLPADSNGLPEAASSLPAGTLGGLNSWKRTGYGGPCPPIGRHRYFFRIYALDTALPDLGKPNRLQLEQAMEGHILGEATLMGTYQKGD